MAEFKITMKCMWSKDGKFKKFRSKLKKTPESQGSKEVVVDVDMKDGDEIVGASG